MAEPELAPGYSEDWNQYADNRAVVGLTEALDQYTRPQVEEILLRKLRFDRTLQAPERLEYEYDSRMYVGRRYLDDELAQMYPRYNDYRTHLIRGPADYLISTLSSQQLEGRVEPAGGAFSVDQIAKIASQCDLRLKAVQKATKFNSHLFRAISDMCVIGQGFLMDGLEQDGNTGKLRFFVKYVDWRNIWCDSMSIEPDLSDANHLFYLTKMDLHEAIRRYPKFEEEFKRACFDSTARVAVPNIDSNFYGEFPSGAEYSYEAESRSEIGRPIVILGQAYIRLYNMQSNDFELYRTQFFTPESMNSLIILDKPTRPYSHDRIPFSRLYYQMDGETKSAFSPMVRHKRGLEKIATALIRSGTRMAAARAIIYNEPEMRAYSHQTGIPMQRLKNEYRKEAAAAVPLLGEYGPPGSLKLENLALDLDGVRAFLADIVTYADKQSGVAPELTGKPSSQIAGVAMEMKREEALKNFPSAINNLDDAVRGTCERMLSNMHQYAGQINYPATEGSDGQLLPMPPDKDASIDKVRMNWVVTPRVSSATVAREQYNMLFGALQKFPPEAIPSFMPLLIRMLNPPGVAQLEKGATDIIRKLGFPIPDIFLSEEDREVMQMEAQKQAAKEEQVRQLEIAKLGNEVLELAAKGDKLQAETMGVLVEKVLQSLVSPVGSSDTASASPGGKPGKPGEPGAMPQPSTASPPVQPEQKETLADKITNPGGGEERDSGALAAAVAQLQNLVNQPGGVLQDPPLMPAELEQQNRMIEQQQQQMLDQQRQQQHANVGGGMGQGQPQQPGAIPPNQESILGMINKMAVPPE